ncbi:sensor histidine kinase [Butyrivibrio sp. YAB3001]|uniref:sensor histidine kinase n=1 Tax=Butyrivibrio sp. YAB3001 TaxID=1520812 RepID=UPI0008F64EBF|nr:GHKL domain-containing protein [Butyrivibrio sp. YAB3001]SFC12423.1 GHKL domain-containing protein [Butyrivibrio sp. YAB3001]
MISAISNIATFYNELCKLLLFGVIFCGAKIEPLSNKFLRYIWLGCSIVIGGIGFAFDKSIASLLNAVLIVVMVKLLCKSIKIRYPILGVFIIALIDSLIAYGAMIFTGVSAEDISNNPILTFVLNGVLTTALFVIWMLKKTRMIDKQNVFRLNVEKQSVVILSASAFFSALIIAYIEQYSIQFDDRMSFFRNSVIIVLCCLFFLSQCIGIFFHTQNGRLSSDVAQKDRLIENQKNYFTDLLDKEEKTKRFRHDFKGHMNCIKTLIDEGDYDKLKEYLESVDGQMAKATLDFSTGNHMINSIIAGIKSQYPGVKIDWRGRIPDVLQVSNPDLCTIFYNLINNACREVDGTDNHVDVDIRIFNTNMFIVVRNKVKNKVQVADKHRVIKKFEEGHGYGLRNVEDAVKRYNGLFEINNENGMFDVDITMPDVI